jgi:DNA mismatch repair protein MutS
VYHSESVHHLKGLTVDIDPKTKRDLELLQTRDGRPGVFQTLDLAKTPGGSRALRFRFENPMSDVALIRQVQDGVRFLMAEEVEFSLDPDLILEVDRYLKSSWAVSRQKSGLRFLFETSAISLRYRDLLRDARDGVRATQRLLSQLIPFLKRLEELDPPSEVRRPVVNLLALIDRVRLDNIRLTHRPWTILSADRFLRAERKADFQRFFELLYDLDSLIAMASASRSLGLSLPEFVDTPEFLLEGEGVFHPFLKEPVGNPVKITEGGGLVFLTGPNMSGKTTYLKAVGISAFLAHLGMAVPAKSLRLSVMQRVFSSLSPEENLWEGLSYFMAEVRRVREVAEYVATGGGTLVIFDEVFRGTNVRDAYEASRLVIQGFAKCRTSGFMFSSHLVELAEDLEAEPGVRFNYLEGQISEGRTRYGFQLKEGVSQQRFGLQLLEQEGVPEILKSL